MLERILIIDDDSYVREAVSLAFTREGFHVTCASSGAEGLTCIETQHFDLIVLDVSLGDYDGFYIIKVIRKKQIHTPVLFLSANGEEQSKILGLSLGGDDYLTKPFSLSLLTTKVNTLLRRTKEYNQGSASQLVQGPFVFNLNTYELYKNNQLIHLTSKESALICFFMQNANQVFTKEQLYLKVWNEHVVNDNTIMVYIKRLRDKIEDDKKNPIYLKTVWGIGYMLDV